MTALLIFAQQQKIVPRVVGLFELVDQLEKQLANARGQDRTVELAEKLLERIKSPLKE